MFTDNLKYFLHAIYEIVKFYYWFPYVRGMPDVQAGSYVRSGSHVQIWTYLLDFFDTL